MVADSDGSSPSLSAMDILRLIDLPSDALADIIGHLALQNCRALMLACKFFTTGDGRASLSSGGLNAAARLLHCQPGDVPGLTSSAGEDGLATAAFVIRAHAIHEPFAASNHTLAVHGGLLQACGANDAGQLGCGRASQFTSTICVPSATYSSADYVARQQRVVEKLDLSSPSPVRLPAGVTVQCVAAGRSHSLVACRDGCVYAFGGNECGQLGLVGGETQLPMPHRVDVDEAASALSDLEIDAHPVWACLPPVAAVGAPTSSPARVVQVAAGELHSLFLLATGVVLACGSGSNGELGNGELGASVTPRRVALPEPARAVAAGGFHSLALAEDPTRRVYGWGIAACGQLGPNADGSRALLARSTPTRIVAAGPDAPDASHALLAPIAQLAAGLHHSLLLTQGGDVLSFGKGAGGALGHGHKYDVREPTPIRALPTRIVHLSAGAAHSVFVTAGGELYTCGTNGGLGRSCDGRLGVAVTTDSGAPTKYALLPVRVPLPSGQRVRRATAGRDHTIAVMEDGHVYVFGRGQAGQLGAGDRKDQLTLFRAPLLEACAFAAAAAQSRQAADARVPTPHSGAVAGAASTSAQSLVAGTVHNRFAVQSEPLWIGDQHSVGDGMSALPSEGPASGPTPTPPPVPTVAMPPPAPATAAALPVNQMRVESSASSPPPQHAAVPPVGFVPVASVLSRW